MHRVLVVEDDPAIAHLVRQHVSSNVLSVGIESDGRVGLELALRGDWDLVLLDWMLPGMAGIEVCRELRRERPRLPIVMLTARTDEVDRVCALEIGADDYVAKPFSILELSARIHAVLRRVEAMSRGGREQPLRLGDMTIDAEQRTVSINERRIELTAREFELLDFLARRPDRVFSRAQLLTDVWGVGFVGYEHTVNSHINRLRAKIEVDPAQPRYILTVWGVGYKFSEAPEA